MVNAILRLLQREFSGLHEAAFLLGISSLFSQLLALLRDRLLASSFGAGRELDIYYAAFRLPDLVYVTLASFVSVTVLIPFLVERLNQENHQSVRKFIDSLFSLFVLATVVVVLALLVLMPKILPLLTPGFTGDDLDQLVLLARVLLLSPLLLGLSNLFGAITQATNRFFVYALSPVLYNTGIIIGIWLFYPAVGLVGLVYGVILGALLHLAIQIPTAFRAGLFPKPAKFWLLDDLKQVLLVSLPRTIALAAHQITLLVLVGLASYMHEGSIAVFNLSFNLQSVPLAIVGVSYSVAAFPALARMYTAGEMEQFIRQMSVTLRHIIFWSMPAMVFFIVLRAQIVRVILGAGNFSWSNTRLVAASLALFAISVIAQSLVLLFVRGYYAAGQTHRPLVINTLASLFIIVMAFVMKMMFIRFESFRYFIEALLRVDNISGTEILMLPAAFSLGLILNLVVFWKLFQKDFAHFPREVYRTVGQSFSASVLAGALAYEILELVGRMINIQTFRGIFTQGLVAGIGGILLWAAVLALMGNKELVELIKALRRRFSKKLPIMPEPAEL